MNEMLLRGCTLKNSGHVLGLVVYTGAETRIQQNAAETPLKYGALPGWQDPQGICTRCRVRSRSASILASGWWHPCAASAHTLSKRPSKFR